MWDSLGTIHSCFPVCACASPPPGVDVKHNKSGCHPGGGFTRLPSDQPSIRHRKQYGQCAAPRLPAGPPGRFGLGHVGLLGCRKSTALLHTLVKGMTFCTFHIFIAFCVFRPLGKRSSQRGPPQSWWDGATPPELCQDIWWRNLIPSVFHWRCSQMHRQCFSITWCYFKCSTISNICWLYEFISNPYQVVQSNT